MDNPESIVEGALEHHMRMINEFKGVPGVMPKRLAEGMQVMRQCAFMTHRKHCCALPESNKLKGSHHSA